MKARLVPLHFGSGVTAEFGAQIDRLRELLGKEAEFLDPLPLGGALPEAEAVIFPEVLGEAYRRVAEFQSITLPILFITTEFATMSMWDWEIASFLEGKGVATIAPYNLHQAVSACRALGIKRELRQSKLLVFQDNPGEGFQGSIFKRFYWWEDECTQRMHDRFGVSVERRSFKEFGAQAQAIDDREAAAVWEQWKTRLPIGAISQRALYSALKIYIAVKRCLDEDSAIKAVGINCLNESHFSDTTPCLAWNMLYEERGLMWGCEGDTVSMLTKHILHKSLDVPIMMTNLYPFLLGQAALKHERIPNFPAVPDDPANYILAAHCGYLGVLPQRFSTEWALRGKVLAIVNDNATAIDARLPVGAITLAKLHASFERISVAEGALTGYAQYPGSDCLNGAVIKVADGKKLVQNLYSHHTLLTTGQNLADIRLLARIFNLEIDVI